MIFIMSRKFLFLHLLAISFTLTVAGIPSDMESSVSHFNGENHQLYDNPGFDWKDGFTFNVWVKPNTSGFVVVSGLMGSDSDPGAFQLKYTDSQSFKLTPNNRPEEIYTGDMVRGDWNLVTVSSKDRNVSLYLNGEFQASETLVVEGYRERNSLIFGRRAWSDDLNFQGSIARASYYDTKLSDAQINSIYTDELKVAEPIEVFEFSSKPTQGLNRSLQPSDEFVSDPYMNRGISGPDVRRVVAWGQILFTILY
jgi:hypothetical protein